MRIVEHRLGPRYSDGAELLWRILRLRKWSQRRLESELGAHGMTSRWLYGERCPGANWATEIEDKLGIRASAWGRPCAEPREILLVLGIDSIRQVPPTVRSIGRLPTSKGRIHRRKSLAATGTDGR